jgi:hypothetical protein
MKKSIILFLLILGCNDGMKNEQLVGEKCLDSNSKKISQGNVLCCCNTLRGQCCKYVSFCGSVIPGCFCNGKSDQFNSIIP